MLPLYLGPRSSAVFSLVQQARSTPYPSPIPNPTRTLTRALTLTPTLATLTPVQEAGGIAEWSVRGPVEDPSAEGDNQGTDAGSGEDLARQRALREAAGGDNQRTSSGGDNQRRKLAAFGAPPSSPPPAPPAPPPPLAPPPSSPWSTEGPNQGKRLDPTSDELRWTG